MIGVTLGAEYALTSRFTLTARADYQSYVEAKGKTQIMDGVENTVQDFRSPLPALTSTLSRSPSASRQASDRHAAPDARELNPAACRSNAGFKARLREWVRV